MSHFVRLGWGLGKKTDGGGGWLQERNEKQSCVLSLWIIKRVFRQLGHTRPPARKLGKRCGRMQLCTFWTRERKIPRHSQEPQLQLLVNATTGERQSRNSIVSQLSPCLLPETTQPQSFADVALSFQLLLHAIVDETPNRCGSPAHV